MSMTGRSWEQDCVTSYSDGTQHAAKRLNCFVPRLLDLDGISEECARTISEMLAVIDALSVCGTAHSETCECTDIYNDDPKCGCGLGEEQIAAHETLERLAPIK